MIGSYLRKMWNRLKKHREILTDGIVDLRRIHVPEPIEEVRFGEVRTFRISEHGQKKEIGQVSLRLGESPGIYYFGHIGYHIDEPYRGHHYASKAVRLLKEQIWLAGKESVVITTDVDNIASQKTCLALGCRRECTVDVPLKLQKDWELSRRKIRSVWDVMQNDTNFCTKEG